MGRLRSTLDEEERRGRQALEQALYQQASLLDARLGALQARTPGRINLYLLAVAGDGNQEVFRREVEFVDAAFAQRFGTAGHSITLVNAKGGAEHTPIASVTSLRRSLDAIAKVAAAGGAVLLPGPGALGTAVEVGEPGARVSYPNLHSVLPSPDGRFAYFVSLGADLIAQYALGDDLALTSRNERPFNRYFPELVTPLLANLPPRCVVDGEIVIPSPSGGLDFDALLQRIHPAESRVARLAAETPASFVAFDLLALGDESLLDAPQRRRRQLLDDALVSSVALTKVELIVAPRMYCSAVRR